MRVKVGIVGCGNIFGQYVQGCRGFEILEVAACADLLPETAVVKAAEFGIPAAYPVEQLLHDPTIDIIVNLTIPQAHASLTLAAIAAGKHVHSEKPLAVTNEDGQKIVALAQEKGVLVSCAPDTFLGGGLQTARKLIDDGWIGTPVAAVAFMMGHGPEAWHPNPGFFYQPGAGPLFDMGPYYLTALVHLLGPVRRVTGSARASFPERIATSPTRFGEKIPVQVPTHTVGVLDFADGPIVTLITSFDIWSHHLPRIEIYGSEGSLSVPDPNIFGGVVQVRRAGASEWNDVPHSHSTEVGRGIGVADLAYAVRDGRSPRASVQLAAHVLEIMHAIVEASANGRHLLIKNQCERPLPLPMGLLKGRLA